MSKLEHTRGAARSEDIAIVGMGCIFPGAPDVVTYWQNITSKVDCISDAVSEDWDMGILYDPNSTEKDRVYCKRGGFLRDREREFNPLKHGIMPTGVEGSEPDQFLAVRAACEAMADAGCLDDPKDKDRTAVILGRGAYVNAGLMNLVQHGWVVEQTLQILKKLHPEYTQSQLQQIKQDLRANLPPLNAEIVPGQIPNIAASRIANRLDLKGPSYTVDAACASSLIAVDSGVRMLQNHECDLAIVGGIQGGNTVLSYILFCLINALSRSSQIRPFDKDADGTILGEGAGMVVLKRSSEAQRDGGRIYAVIKGVGTSSDGRALGLLAPNPEGAELALIRAYDAANLSPSTVGLIEGHGTATPAGDAMEIDALKRVFGDRSRSVPSCAVGSVKSMIGHLLGAAGIAGLIKTALAIYHKVLPPTLNCSEPNPQLEFDRTPFYINTDVRPWIHYSQEIPRRAGVNAFGFGGINAHAVLEEYNGGIETAAGSYQCHWETEVFVLQGDSRNGLMDRGRRLQEYLSTAPDVELKDLAYTVNTPFDDSPYRLAIVASSLQDLAKKLANALKRLADTHCKRIKARDGIYFFEEPLNRRGKLAFLFPGEGSQYVNMLSDLCIHFPEVRQCFDRMDRIFYGHTRGYLPSDSIFPCPFFSEAKRKEIEERLWNMAGAVEAVLTANDALYNLLTCLEIKPDVLLGHSTGEYSALHASGIFSLIDKSDNGRRVLELNKNYEKEALDDRIPRTRLIALGADSEKVATLIDQTDGELYIAMDNCPHQTVIAGTEAATQKALEEMNRHGIICQILPFDRPYHTPLFKPHAKTLQQFFEAWPVVLPSLPIYSCTTAGPFPDNTDEIRKLVVDHWVRPVEFRKTIQRMYADGVRIFVEVGPRGNLTAFVDDILRGQEYIAVAANVAARSGITQLNCLVGMLAAQGASMSLEYLYARRAPKKLAFDCTLDSTDGKGNTAGTMSLSLEFQRLQLEQSSPVRGRGEKTSSLDHRTNEAASLASREIPQALPREKRISNPRNSSNNRSQVMQEYFNTMEHFLEVQNEVIHNFLKGKGISEPMTSTFTPADADTPTARHTVDGDRQSLSVGNQASETIGATLLALVSEKTGYPAEMLDPNLNMEADLGIDSIKRTEIIGILNERYGRQLSQETEQLVGLKTLQQVIDFLESRLAGFNNLSVEPTREGSTSTHGVDAVISPPNVELKRFPMIDKITSLVPGQKLVALRRISLDEDRYLQDHTLGGKVSSMDNTLRPLSVMPLTMSMEILAEAASLLIYGKVLIGMKDIMAHRWIALEENSANLQIVASRRPESNLEVEVKIYNFSEDKTASDDPVIEGTMVFGAEYPQPPDVDAFLLRSERASKWTQEQLYTKGMFHGQRWQGVSSVDRWGEDGSIATFNVLPFSDFFHSENNPDFVIDPIVLDAAGQIVGFWTMEHLDRGYLVFPFRVKALHIYRPQLPAHQKVRCQARIKLVGTLQVISDIDMIGEDGQLWMRLEGWEDKRFDLPSNMYQFLLSPLQVIPSMKWDVPIKSFPDTSSFYCCRIGAFSRGDENFWRQVFSHLILNHNERKIFRNLGKSVKRQTQWLTGRLVAKDAVRMILKEHYGIEVGPAEVEIGKDGYGRPVPGGAWANKIETVPALSLSHTNGLAVAVACCSDAGRQVGIDIEQVRAFAQGFEKTALTPEEQRLLDLVGESDRPQWLIRLWCAKEAVAKALGRGLIEGPQSLSVQGLDVPIGTVKVALQGKLADEFPDFANTTVTVHTDREKDYIVTSTVCQRD